MAESMVDEFGIRMIYPTNTHPNRAKPCLLGKGDWVKRRYNGLGDWNDMPISTDPDGNFIINFFTSGRKGRMPVLSLRLDEYPVDSITDIPVVVSATNQSNLRKRGFMGTKNDWKNVEMTLYFKIEEVTDADFRAMAFCARGGPHHYKRTPLIGGPPCTGTCYLTVLSIDGSVFIQRELGHPLYADGPSSDPVTANLMHRWVGMKGVFYTKANGNPVIELWLDKEATNNWERVLPPYEDDGNLYLRKDPDHDGNIEGEDPFGNPILIHGNGCGGETNEQITWGGPGVIFKLADLRRVDMKWASVREILPPEGWPLRYLLDARGVPLPFSMRRLAEEYGLTAPISLRQLTELEAERYPFP